MQQMHAKTSSADPNHSGTLSEEVRIFQALGSNVCLSAEVKRLPKFQINFIDFKFGQLVEEPKRKCLELFQRSWFGLKVKSVWSYVCLSRIYFGTICSLVLKIGMCIFGSQGKIDFELSMASPHSVP